MSAADIQSAQGAADAECMAAIVERRDRDAFRTLFLRYAPRLKTYLIRHGATGAQAEELAQEAMLTLWRKADYYDPARATLSAWLFTIARNLRIDTLRRERSAIAYQLISNPDLEPPPLAPDAEREVAEREARVREAVRVLPPEQLEVVRLSYFSDKPHGEIAAILALPLGTVKSRLRLAAVRLRAILEDLA